MSADEVRAMMRHAYDLMSSGDLDGFLELAAPDFVDHNPDPGQGPGIEGVRESFARFLGAFPDLRMTPQEILVDDDKAIARTVMTGTHRGELNGIPATGKSVRVEVIDIVRFENGKAKERWGIYDALAMMQQLGLVPEAEAAPA